MGSPGYGSGPVGSWPGTAPLTLAQCFPPPLPPIKTISVCCSSYWEGFHKTIYSKLVLTQCTDLPQTICIFIGNRECKGREPKGAISSSTADGYGSYLGVRSVRVSLALFFWLILTCVSTEPTTSFIGMTLQPTEQPGQGRIFPKCSQVGYHLRVVPPTNFASLGRNANNYDNDDDDVDDGGSLSSLTVSQGISLIFGNPQIREIS